MLAGTPSAPSTCAATRAEGAESMTPAGQARRGRQRERTLQQHRNPGITHPQPRTHLSPFPHPSSLHTHHRRIAGVLRAVEIRPRQARRPHRLPHLPSQHLAISLRQADLAPCPPRRRAVAAPVSMRGICTARRGRGAHRVRVLAAHAPIPRRTDLRETLQSRRGLRHRRAAAHAPTADVQQAQHQQLGQHAQGDHLGARQPPRGRQETP